MRMVSSIRANRVRGMAVVALALGGPAGAQAPAGTGANVDWPLHNLDIRNSRYAPLDEINASNVARLTVKWSYDAGAVDSIARNTPLVVDGVMYVDAGSKLFAVDAATGRLLWNVADRPAVSRHRPRTDLRRRQDLRVWPVDPVRGRREDRPDRRIVRQQGTVGDRACRPAIQVSRQGPDRLPADGQPRVLQRHAVPRPRAVGASHSGRAGRRGRRQDRERSSGCSTPCRKGLPTMAGRSRSETWSGGARAGGGSLVAARDRYRAGTHLRQRRQSVARLRRVGAQRDESLHELDSRAESADRESSPGTTRRFITRSGISIWSPVRCSSMSRSAGGRSRASDRPARTVSCTCGTARRASPSTRWSKHPWRPRPTFREKRCGRRSRSRTRRKACRCSRSARRFRW